MSLWQEAALFAAAFVAGVINAIAGGGTLVSFPTLLWLGRDPIVANATNTVSLWPGSLASMLALRRELAGVRAWTVGLGLPSLVGGAVGAVLLLRTPTRVFAAMVPYLILFATGLFALQAPLARLLLALRRRTRPPSAVPAEGARRRSAGSIPALAFQLGVAIYGGYFGAGIGIIMLAAFGLLGFTDIHQMLALRNFCGLCVNAVAAAYFAARGAVDWRDATVMTVGQIAGGYGGARMARLMGRGTVRRIVILVGLGMAASLLLSPRS